MKKWVLLFLLLVSLSCDNDLTSRNLFNSENKDSSEGFIENTDKEDSDIPKKDDTNTEPEPYDPWFEREYRW